MKPVIISAVIILNITMNSIVIAVIAKYPQLREDRTALFMLSLTLSDLAAGCTYMPISAALCSNATPHVRNMHVYLPKIHEICMTWFSFCSLHSLCWVTVSKMVAILKPFRYEQLFTRKRCYAIIACIWSTGALIGLARSRSFVSWNLTACSSYVTTLPENSKFLEVGLLLFIVFPVITIVYATARIIIVIIRVHYQITMQVNSIGGQSVVTGNSGSLTMQSIRSGRNVLVICAGILVLAMPFTAYALARIMGLETELPYWYTFVAPWIMMCNSFVNSILYLILFRSVRKRTMEMFTDIFQLCCFQ